MITQINIKNFKSIVDSEFPLGGFNVLIGANGSGKTNILEAISFMSAASTDKLDNEFLGLRGIRVTEPKFMMSGFEEQPEYVFFEVYTDHNAYCFYYQIPISYADKRWHSIGIIERDPNFQKNVTSAEIYVPPKSNEKSQKTIDSFFTEEDYAFDNISQFKRDVKSFLSYCPEESALRTFREEIQTLPLGRKGEGLFRYLKELGQTEKGIQILQEIKEKLYLLDWYDDLKIPENSFSNDSTVLIRDRYLNETLQYFDQRSTNEGFLYLLFYLTLFISDETPEFFAIDNIESAFNPKMCTELIRILTDLARKHGKQVIVTTHNPAVLDGLNLANDDERLFVVRRNIDGHTRINRIEHKTERTMKLSEIWLNGFIGGLPDNF